LPVTEHKGCAAVHRLWQEPGKLPGRCRRQRLPRPLYTDFIYTTWCVSIFFFLHFNSWTRLWCDEVPNHLWSALDRKLKNNSAIQSFFNILIRLRVYLLLSTRISCHVWHLGSTRRLFCLFSLYFLCFINTCNVCDISFAVVVYILFSVLQKCFLRQFKCNIYIKFSLGLNLIQARGLCVLLIHFW